MPQVQPQYPVPATPTAGAGSRDRRLREADASSRPALQAFIARRFGEVHDARIRHFMPRLFGLYDARDQLMAAFGLRAAQDQVLFLERYLDARIDACVAERHGGPVARGRIVEVGNLAGASPGALRELILQLSQRLDDEGYHWVVFTGSARLCNSFTRLGLPLSVIAAAPVERLSADERADWGRYYEHSPSVMLGDIRGGRRQLQNQQARAGNHDPLAAIAGLGAP